LKELKNETIDTVHGSIMLSDTLVIKIIQFCMYMLSAKKVLDIGTYTGYSALAMAEVVGPKGVVYTLDRTVQPSISVAKKYFAKSDYNDIIQLILGDALDTIPNLQVIFDLVFIDADKMSSKDYYEAVIPKVRSGGIIIIDDCLWRSKVINPRKDKRAEALNKLNHYIVEDSRVDNVLLPIRHGMNIIRKI
jgi:predicted O-methyltransferase YrrM